MLLVLKPSNFSNFDVRLALVQFKFVKKSELTCMGWLETQKRISKPGLSLKISIFIRPKSKLDTYVRYVEHSGLGSQRFDDTPTSKFLVQSSYETKTLSTKKLIFFKDWGKCM